MTALQKTYRDQRGITGLETAIVLIAFVVVSSVFAFAALSTGLFASDKAKETIQAGLAGTRGTMVMKSSLVLTASVTGSDGTISDIAFQVANAVGGTAIDLTPGKTIIKYTDPFQSKMFLTDSSSEGFTATGLGSADSDMILERNELYELKLNGLETLDSGDNNLTTKLSGNTTFSLEIIAPRGAVLFIERTTSDFMDDVMSLD